MLGALRRAENFVPPADAADDGGLLNARGRTSEGSRGDRELKLLLAEHEFDNAPWHR